MPIEDIGKEVRMINYFKFKGSK